MKVRAVRDVNCSREKGFLEVADLDPLQEGDVVGADVDVLEARHALGEVVLELEVEVLVDRPLQIEASTPEADAGLARIDVELILDHLTWADDPRVEEHPTTDGHLEVSIGSLHPKAALPVGPEGILFEKGRDFCGRLRCLCGNRLRSLVLAAGSLQKFGVFLLADLVATAQDVEDFLDDRLGFSGGLIRTGGRRRQQQAEANGERTLPTKFHCFFLHCARPFSLANTAIQVDRHPHEPTVAP